MNLYKNLTVTIFLLFFNIVTSQNSSKNLFVLNANYKNLKDSTKIVLSRVDLKNRTFYDKDSTYSLSGRFTFKDELNRFDYFKITFYDKNSGKYLKSFGLYLDGSEISIKGNFNELKKTSVKGSELFKIANDLEKELEWTREQRKKYNWTIEKQQMEVGKKFKAYVFKNPNNSISLDRLISFSLEVPKDSLELFYSKLDAYLQNSKNGIVLRNIISNNKLNIGDFYEDFESKNLEGELVKLSDFKGKVILIDFWASWCGPCHNQNQNEIPKLIEKFKNEDFVVISYSVDDKKSKWVKSSLDDSITWVNISNLKGINDEVRIKYGVEGYPTNVIIDKKGIIRYHFLGSKGTVLEKSIETVLQE